MREDTIGSVNGCPYSGDFGGLLLPQVDCMLCSCFWIQPWGFGIPVGWSILGPSVARDFLAMVAGPCVGVRVAGCGADSGLVGGTWKRVFYVPPHYRFFSGFPKTGGLRFLP